MTELVAGEGAGVAEYLGWYWVFVWLAVLDSAAVVAEVVYCEYYGTGV